MELGLGLTVGEVSSKENMGPRPLVSLAGGRCPSEWILPPTCMLLCPLRRQRDPRAGGDPHEEKISRQRGPSRRADAQGHDPSRGPKQCEGFEPRAHGSAQ